VAQPSLADQPWNTSLFFLENHFLLLVGQSVHTTRPAGPHNSCSVVSFYR